MKRVRREPLGASCLGHSQVQGGSPSRGHPPLPWERSSSSTQEMKIRFQLCLRLFPTAVAAPSILTVPKLPLMVRCPYHTQHQGKPLACHVMMHSGGKRKRVSRGSHTQAKAPFFLPCHKLPC